MQLFIFSVFDLSAMFQALLPWGSTEIKHGTREGNGKVMRKKRSLLYSLGHTWRCWLVLVAPYFPTLCDPMDCSPPGSSIRGHSPGKNTGVGCLALLPGIFSSQGLNPGLLHCRQVLYHLSHQGSPRIQEWAAYPFSRGTS